MRGRHRVHTSCRRDSLAGHRLGRAGIAAHKHHGAGPLAIQANVFRGGDGDNHLGHARKYRADTRGVIIKTSPHALIRKVDHGQ